MIRALHPGPRRGAHSLLATLLLPALIGLGALCIDLSYRAVVRAERQVAAEVAADAASDLLDGTAAGLEAARSTALRAASRNTAGGHPVYLAEADVELGRWDDRTGGFVPEQRPELIDAVRVHVPGDGLGEGPSAVAIGRWPDGSQASALGHRP